MKQRNLPIGNRNIIGQKVAALRKEKGMKQKDFLAKLQSEGLDISATALSRLEGQQRLVQDYELPIIAKVLNVSIEELLDLQTFPDE